MTKHHIKICLGSSCFSRGNNANLSIIKNYLQEHALDVDVSFSGRLCEEMCSRGPVITIDDRTYENVNVSRLHKIMEEEFRC